MNGDEAAPPPGWALSPLATFEPFVTSGSRGWAKYYAETGDAFIRITNLTRDQIALDLADLRYVRVPASDSEGSRTSLQIGDILISITADIGIVGLVDEYLPLPAYINQHIAVVRLPSSRLNSKFVAYSLATAQSQRRFRELTDAGAKAGMSLDTIRKLEILAPEDVEEQRYVAQALSDIDDLLASLDALIAKKRDIKQGAMQELLTGKRRLPGFSGRWTSVPFRQALRVRHGKSQKQVEVEGGIYPILATGGEIGRCNAPLYDKPSVLIGRKGTIDRPQYIETPFWSVDTLFYTEIQRGFSPKFIYYAFQRINWKGFNEASGVPSLNAKTIEDIEVALPEEPEQRAIVEVLDKMEGEIANAEAKREKLALLRQAMMQQLLTGRIRLS